MKFSLTVALTSLAALAMSSSLSSSSLFVQGGQVFSFFHPPPRRDPNQDLRPPILPPNHQHAGHPPPVPHLEWNSQIGQQSRQGGPRAQQFQPYEDFALQPDPQQQQQQVVAGGLADNGGPGCRSRNKVYLPDMQSFLISVPLTFAEAAQACLACGSELVLVDGTNLDRFGEAFSSLGLYADQRLWIKSWFGEEVRHQGTCPAVVVNPMMGNRLEPIEEDCQTRLYALCY